LLTTIFMRNQGRRVGAVLGFVIVLALTAACGQTQWVGTWSASPLLCDEENALPADDLKDITLRQIVHVSLGGTRLQLRLSNRFGIAPLRFTSVHVARPTSTAGHIVMGSDRAVIFSGRPDVILPAGADYVSDPVEYTLEPLSDLAVTIHVDALPETQTGHPGSRTTSYLAHGNFVSASDLPNPETIDHWYFLSGVDVAGTPASKVIVAFGDSITDGHGATLDANDRWPDVLAKRLAAGPAKERFAVLNQGIGGNRLLLDGIATNALARFDQDVLVQASVNYLIVLEGINDIGMLVHGGEVSQAEHELLVHRIVAAYEQMIMRAHKRGIQVVGATILPFGGSAFYHPGPTSEADRQAVNQWIRATGHFDAVIDFDAVMREPQHPDHLLPALDSGDHLHPSPAGYAAMGNAIPLSLFGLHGTALPPK
jgi:lysophospholipase L1-like esterase